MGKASKRAPRKRKGPGLGTVAAIAVAGVAALVAVAVAFSPKASTPKLTDAEMGAQGYTRGPDTAKVKVVEYGDFL